MPKFKISKILIFLIKIVIIKCLKKFLFFYFNIIHFSLNNFQYDPKAHMIHLFKIFAKFVN